MKMLSTEKSNASEDCISEGDEAEQGAAERKIPIETSSWKDGWTIALLY
jgi:hypothetical protein